MTNGASLGSQLRKKRVRFPPGGHNNIGEETMIVEVRPGEGGDDALAFAQECL